MGEISGMEAGCYVSFAVAFVFVAARLYTRHFLVGAFGLDDFFLFVAFLNSIAILVCVPIMFKLGIGKHITTITMEGFFQARKWAWISQIFYYGAVGSVKCSIIALYYRLASKNVHKLVLKIFGGALLGHTIAVVITTSRMCDPVNVIWGPTFPAGCIDLLNFNYFNAAFHIATDIAVAVAPIPILKGLQISQRKKMGLVVVFAVGALTIIGTIARQVTNAIALTNRDFTWYWAGAELCTCIEVNMGLICATAPVLRPLFKGVFSGSSRDNGYELEGSSKGKSEGGAGSQPGYTTKIFASRSKQSKTLTSSNESEEHIVPSPGQGQVVKNVEYRVDYSTA
ncbi:hypothetical protein FN846DRAFT_946201 [Sphaerosporella brunnea]|uniref:Rhodopsin domain-containing protein n=1 Tax=Sphaerosporella brunnea TaxID=1250544 RepID=A0A5J5EYE0_9PEZI|nr:hypothetical protein FN846DRAFT_946201 [Sphaerosporella brunnea]